jgi:hypothetical protein
LNLIAAILRHRDAPSRPSRRSLRLRQDASQAISSRKTGVFHKTRETRAPPHIPNDIKFVKISRQAAAPIEANPKNRLDADSKKPLWLQRRAASKFAWLCMSFSIINKTVFHAPSP